MLKMMGGFRDSTGGKVLAFVRAADLGSISEHLHSLSATRRWSLRESGVSSEQCRVWPQTKIILIKKKKDAFDLISER